MMSVFHVNTNEVNVLLLCAHTPDKDPRVTWFIDTKEPSFVLNAVGVGQKKEFVRHTASGGMVWETTRAYERDLGSLILKYGINPGFSALSTLNTIWELDEASFANVLGVPVSSVRLPQFRWYLSYLYECSMAVIDAGLKTSGLDLLIAVDLDVLPGVVALGKIFNIPVLFDAHEYWPDSDPASEPWERKFWKQIQDTLLPSLAGISTVSPHLSTCYDHPNVFCIPNATMLVPPQQPTRDKSNEEIIFIYLGGFAERRGLLSLISNWEGLPESAKLHIRGPYNHYSKLMEQRAQELGLLNKTIFFLNSVSESELIPAAAMADVGIIPYEPYCKTYANCSPNKLSQYLAAGLPIISNKLEYVGGLIEENDLGFCVDFNNKTDFQRTVIHLLNSREELQRLSKRARDFFETQYNWESVSDPIYQFMKNAVIENHGNKKKTLNIDMGLDSTKQSNSNEKLKFQLKSSHSLAGRGSIRSPQYFWLDKANVSYTTLLKYTFLRTLGGIKRKLFSKKLSTRANTNIRKLLLVCYYNPKGLETIVSNVNALVSYSKHKIDICNFFGQGAPFNFKKNISLQKYDGILFHSTVTYDTSCIQRLVDDPRLQGFKGIKIVFKQDEHVNTQKTIQFLKQIRADGLCTLLEPEQWEVVYPKSELAHLQFFKTLTGYVTPDLRGIPPIPFKDRKNDICYRGSLNPIYFGRHAYDKTDITYKFNEHQASESLVSDVSSRMEDRIHGQAWLDFMANSRATLGVESGASIFDLDGLVQSHYHRFLNHEPEDLSNNDWCEKMLDKLKFLEDRVSYKALSPRHFEAAATRTLQVLYPGTYSGILEEGKHYLKLEKDFSNLENLIPLIKDENFHKNMTDTVYNEIILNQKFWIESFLSDFDIFVDKLAWSHLE